MDEAIKLPIGPEEVAEAAQILQRYKAGKAALDKRLVDNELWFRMGHWKNYQNPMMEGKPQPSSGWLFNSIANKHADAMDNYPSPNVLPRAEDDEAAAQALSSVLPVVLEQADYEQVYSDTWWRKLKQGTGVKGVFWDPEQRGGVGEIAIRPMNLLMLYWEPGVDDIQASPHFFSLSLANTAQLESRWPQLAGHTASVLDVPHYIHDGGLDTSDKSVVVDWYYKKLSPEGRSVLHYCKFCNGVVLYASENDPALAERRLFMTVGEAMERAEELRPGSRVAARTRQCWLCEVDGMLREKFFRPSSADSREGVGADIAWDNGLRDDDVLLVPPPFDSLYPHYLCAMTDAALGENDRYAGEQAQYNSILAELAAWLRRKNLPARGCSWRW